MALSDPQSIVIGANTRTLARTSTQPSESVYTDLDNGVAFKAAHTVAKRRQSMIRIDLSKIAADPLTAVNQRLQASAWLVINAPLSGFSRTELKELAVALATWATAGSSANLLKVLGEET